MKKTLLVKRATLLKLYLANHMLKQVLDHLSPDESINSKARSQFPNYVIESRDTLNMKLQNAVPVPAPFVMTKDVNLFLVFQCSKAIKFQFADLIEMQMDQFYFNITFLQSVENPFLQIEHKYPSVKCALLPSISTSKEIYYMAVTNEWLTLDKHGYFEVHSNSNLQIRYSNI